VRATKGRFFWVSREQPLIRIAVFDLDPAGRTLSLGGTKVQEVNDDQTHLPGFSFPASVFKNSARLMWDSSLFLKVDVSDLTLRYPR
jgi:hypothetical protein